MIEGVRGGFMVATVKSSLALGAYLSVKELPMTPVFFLPTTLTTGTRLRTAEFVLECINCVPLSSI